MTYGVALYKNLEIVDSVRHQRNIKTQAKTCLRSIELRSRRGPDAIFDSDVGLMCRSRRGDASIYEYVTEIKALNILF